jgi:fatty acid desaturase
MWTALDHGYWTGLLLVGPAAGLLVRLFMIQHDCGHGSFGYQPITSGSPPLFNLAA